MKKLIFPPRIKLFLKRKKFNNFLIFVILDLKNKYKFFPKHDVVQDVNDDIYADGLFLSLEVLNFQS